MITYKLWVEIERYDDEADEYVTITQHVADDNGDFAEPVPIGLFDNLDDAVAYAESLDYVKESGL